MLNENQIKNLITQSLEARQQSYSPFSGFSVGAALMAEDETVWKGCNVEISGLGSTCCAERTAIFKAVSEGYQKFVAVAIVGGKTNEPLEALCAPCGICRQVLAEFADLDQFQVILATSTENYKIYTLGELLPLAFKRADC